MSYLRGAYGENTGRVVSHNWEWAPRTAPIILDWVVQKFKQWTWRFFFVWLALIILHRSLYRIIFYQRWALSTLQRYTVDLCFFVFFYFCNFWLFYFCKNSMTNRLGTIIKRLVDDTTIFSPRYFAADIFGLREVSQDKSEPYDFLLFV